MLCPAVRSIPFTRRSLARSPFPRNSLTCSISRRKCSLARTFILHRLSDILEKFNLQFLKAHSIYYPSLKYHIYAAKDGKDIRDL